MKIPCYEVLGVPVSATTLETASAAVLSWASDSQGRFVIIRDVHGIMEAQEDSELMELHQRAAMVTPDGMPLVWLGRHAGHPVERTCGPDLMEKILSQSPQTGLRHYFYGGKPGIAERLRKVFESSYPGVAIVGTGAPPFRPLSPQELADAAERIRESGAHVVWIGISTPKQEFLMRDLAPLVPATLLGVGAAFDFHSGAVKRAPLWMQRNGLEWLHRLASEPRRLWRRYLVMAPRFVWLVAIRR